MQELEKILKEIDETIGRYGSNPELITEDITDFCYGLNVAKGIIRKHMNDGWIPVDKQLPDESLNSVIGWDDYRDRCVFVQYYNGRWILGDGTESVKIIAWRPLPEPYRPKKESEGSRQLRERKEFFKE